MADGQSNLSLDQDNTLAPLTHQAAVKAAPIPNPEDYKELFSTVDHSVVGEIRKELETLKSNLKAKEMELTEIKGSLSLYSNKANWIATDEKQAQFVFKPFTNDNERDQELTTSPWLQALLASEGFKEYRHKPFVVKARRLAAPLLLNTNRGPIQVRAGDWVILNDDGGLFPISHEDFFKSYELKK